MATTFYEFMDWLAEHPKAELTVADDVWTALRETSPRTRTREIQALCGQPMRHSMALKDGTILGVEPDLFYHHDMRAKDNFRCIVLPKPGKAR